MFNLFRSDHTISLVAIASSIFILSSTTGHTMDLNPSQWFDFSLSNQENLQHTTINLSRQELQHPQILTISAPPATQLWGKIEINERVIREIDSSHIKVDLSSHISQTGKHIVKISGSYNPASASISVEYSSSSNQVSQTTGGSGNFTQIWEVNVR